MTVSFQSTPRNLLRLAGRRTSNSYLSRLAHTSLRQSPCRLGKLFLREERNRKGAFVSSPLYYVPLR